MVKQFIVVKNTEDFGFWEIDTSKNIANLRKRTFKIPDDASIVFNEHLYENIQQYIESEFDKTHVKEVIKDKKYIFSRKVFCSKCSNTAFVINDENNPLCKEHMGFKIH